MKVAVPLDKDKKVYHSNPWTAPFFCLFEIKLNSDVAYIMSRECVENPWISEDESIICDPMSCIDGCSEMVKGDINHLADHYILLEVVSGFDFMIADTFCENVEKVLENGKIKIYKMPPFISNADAALKNLLINQSYVKKVTNIKDVTE